MVAGLQRLWLCPGQGRDLGRLPQRPPVTAGPAARDFDDASDFIGWYTDQSQKKLGISKWDTYNQYLAYHEGQGGFSRRTYAKKDWLIRIARKVDGWARNYGGQLRACRARLGD